MFCPYCAGELKLIEKKEFEYNDDWYDLPDNEQTEYLEQLRAYESCEREEYECTGNRCFQKDFPLYFHHPFRGIETAPGDSWSLSWIK